MPCCWKQSKSISFKDKIGELSSMKKKDKEETSFKRKKTIPNDIPIIWVNV
jgi:hypothetical protein